MRKDIRKGMRKEIKKIRMKKMMHVRVLMNIFINIRIMIKNKKMKSSSIRMVKIRQINSQSKYIQKIKNRRKIHKCKKE